MKYHPSSIPERRKIDPNLLGICILNIHTHVVPVGPHDHSSELVHQSPLIMIRCHDSAFPTAGLVETIADCACRVGSALGHRCGGCNRVHLFPMDNTKMGVVSMHF